MDYKEKIEEAKRLYETANADQKYVLESLFPELRESENERIKKSLISYLHGLGEFDYPDKKTYHDWLKWLENQGEQKPIESKDNERLRKTTIAFLKDFANQGYENAVECIDWLEKLGEQKPSLFETPETPIKDTTEVSSRMQSIDDDLKPIADFIIDYASWNLHKEEWSCPTLTVPLFRVLDALIQRGKPYIFRG